MKNSKQLILFLFFLFALLPFAPVQGQGESPALEQLAIELWPDYDRPLVLVLLTGVLDASVDLPATLTLPLPTGADVNAVARISDTNTMVDDIEFEVSEGQITLTTPDPRFRVEYYVPYTAEDTAHTFVMDWAYPMVIGEVTVAAQQPAAAMDFVVEPVPESVITGEDGLTYHHLASQPLTLGQPLSVRLHYTLSDNQLTIGTLESDTTDSAPTINESDTESAAAVRTNWPLILVGVGGLIISGTLIWQGLKERSTQQKKPLARRQPPRPIKNLPNKRSATSSAPSEIPRYCHQCGQEAHADDRFCRQCGTPLKGR
ncbi:MAG: zinc ribbon domain-containing protein [Chloroflexi bacterium]|nr:zinc ribbon domain-containing protein [Chloroflexota bacterium]MBP8057772.1 zinc ribbon domain-containing protein [Chloroflexota bacterium]